MKSIAFIDMEVNPRLNEIIDMGGVKPDGTSFHSISTKALKDFLLGIKYICGHNVINHDSEYIYKVLEESGYKHIDDICFIDTLFLSPLLFSARPYHALIKNDKLQSEELNNPLSDSIKAKDLFYDEVTAFNRLDEELKYIYYGLLGEEKEFASFFSYLEVESEDVGGKGSSDDIADAIKKRFKDKICDNANVKSLIEDKPIQLAYSLALINANDRYSIIPPWVLMNFPEVDKVMYLLRNKPCVPGCHYCDDALNIHKGLNRFFGFDSYRTYEGKSLQEDAVRAAVANKSLLAIFPTGGGKSLTFQVPALMSGVNSKGLTVVISPLQSLMKDQVDNLEKAGITEAVTVNGLLDPIERAKAIERVENGPAAILYISPESLRSRTMERLLLGRNVVRFVIDEAHCFSTWGQDFRVDYLYIGDFIKSYQEKKNLAFDIPVSCFTATAKLKVIEDIKEYFREKLSVEMEIFSSTAPRSNLNYKVLMKRDDTEKYITLRDLINAKNCPTIVFVSRTKKADDIAEKLRKDGYSARSFHGQMPKHEKTENQDAFIQGAVQIMVATSAFGMGVDKKDVGLVIHFEVSGSLENYVQEAGRAGRDQSLTADCYILYNDDDLNKHFTLLNQTKINIKEIKQIWKAVKELTQMRSRISQSAFEIAREAGWDTDIKDVGTRVTTAIAALEDGGFLRRGQNSPRVFADSILVRNVAEAVEKIECSSAFDEEQKDYGIRIIKMLISARSRKDIRDDKDVASVDYISERLAIDKKEVIEVVQLLRQEKILSDGKDLTGFIKKSRKENYYRTYIDFYFNLERFLLEELEEKETAKNLKELNEGAVLQGISNASVKRIKTILNLWEIGGWIRKTPYDNNSSYLKICLLHDKELFKEKIVKRHDLAIFIMEYLRDLSKANQEAGALEGTDSGTIIPVEFSILELKEKYEDIITMFGNETTVKEIENTLFYLSRIDAIKIEGGFMVIYSPITIERLEHDNRKRYNTEDYGKLKEYYDNKVRQIHIVGEYAQRMIDNYKDALQFVDDYFQLNHLSFLNKYFRGDRLAEIERNISSSKFRELFGQLSLAQLEIIKDKESKYIVVAAGPGSGKTRILVHKLASLVMMEDVRSEQMLMLTFSRSAVTEFKRRLMKLIGGAAHFVEIKTFHSYCFDLLGRVGTLEKADNIIGEAVSLIEKGQVDSSRITKMVLVIDEAQDMDGQEFRLIETLMKHNEEMRVIAVGDDDQNIFEFRGASNEYMKALAENEDTTRYELVENYRSMANIVDFSNQVVERIPGRLKKTPVMAKEPENGKIIVTRYYSNNLICPLVGDILKTWLSGSTCVLTKTNDEAMQIVGLLLKNGVNAKLIRSNDEFNLYNLLEVRYFIEELNLGEGISIIDDESWSSAKKSLIKRFTTSPNLEMIVNLVKSFESVNVKYKYRSDLEAFIYESRLEDFFDKSIETINVSTIHKAKGKEFDNVYLLLDRFDIRAEETVRQLYVAVTRAKKNLFIHYNGRYLDNINTVVMETAVDRGRYQAPGQIFMQLSFRDVWLDFFLTHQGAISNLNSGDSLVPEDDCCRNMRGQVVIRYSKAAMQRIEYLKQRNYILSSASVKYILYWKREDLKSEVRIVLPELCLTRFEDQ